MAGLRIQAAQRLLLALVSLAGGCIPVVWHRTDPTGRFERWQQVKVWSRGNLERWHAVIVSRDSISGVPYKMPRDCESCRRSIALTDVDSIRRASPLGAWVLMAVGATAAVYGLVHAK